MSEFDGTKEYIGIPQTDEEIRQEAIKNFLANGIYIPAKEYMKGKDGWQKITFTMYCKGELEKVAHAMSTVEPVEGTPPEPKLGRYVVGYYDFSTVDEVVGVKLGDKTAEDYKN